MLLFVVVVVVAFDKFKSLSLSNSACTFIFVCRERSARKTKEWIDVAKEIVEESKTVIAIAQSVVDVCTDVEMKKVSGLDWIPFCVQLQDMNFSCPRHYSK